MSGERPQPLHADDRARLLQAADERPLGERLLARLVIEDGLSLVQCVGIVVGDLSDGVVTITSKVGMREARRLSPCSAELARQAADGKPSDAHLVTGRTGRPLSAVAARKLLLRLVRASGVSLRSVHALRPERPLVATA